VVAEKAEEILRAAATLESYSEHTIGKVIVGEAKSRGFSLGRVDNFVATPGEGVSGETDGGRVLVGRREFVGVPESWRRDEVAGLQREGNMVVFVSTGAKIGAIAIGDAVKGDARRSVAELSAMGLSVMMLTGDDKTTAEAVAKQVGLAQFRADLLPADKEKVVRQMQKEGRVVAMVGDGVNDAPALAKADLGLALGSGTDVAKETGGIVLVKDRMSDVVDAFRIGRATMRKIRQNLAWAFGYNIILIPVAAGALIPFYGVGVYSVLPFLSGAAMAFSSASVVLNSLLLMRYSPRPESSV
jgi:Cu+-exporting ATPase